MPDANKNTQASTQPGPASTFYPWAVVGMLWSICFFNYADRQAIFSVFPLLRTDLHLNDVQLGLLGSAFAWVYGLGSPFAGAIADRVRRKRAILSGLYAWSIICMATALSRRFLTLMFYRAAEAVGETFYQPASMSMLSDYHGPATRSRALGIHQTSVYLGTIGGGFFAGYIGQHYGWRLSFVVFGGLGLILGSILIWTLREPRRGGDQHAALPPAASSTWADECAILRLLFTTPTALLLMSAFVCSNFVAMVLFSWMPTFLYSRFHLTLAMAGLTATVFAQLASVAGSSCGGWLADIFYRRTPRGRILVQLIGVLGGAPFVAACGLAHSVLWLIVTLTAWGFFKGLYDANIFASVFDVVPPAARGRAAGLMNMVGFLGGGGTAPLVIGMIARNHGLGLGISVASAVYIFAAVFLLTAAIRYVSSDVLRVAAGPLTEGDPVVLPETL
jgi:MFS family permease